MLHQHHCICREGRDAFLLTISRDKELAAQAVLGADRLQTLTMT